MFDCTLTEVEVWADDASNFRTRWRFYNRMKERKVDAAARQPLVLSKKYFLPNVMQLKKNGSFGECLGDSYQRTHLTEGGHIGPTLAPEAILFESPCRAHSETKIAQTLCQGRDFHHFFYS